MPRRTRTPFTLFRHDDSDPIWWVQFVVAGRRYRRSTGETDRGEAELRAAGIWQEARARAGDPAPSAGPARPLPQLAAELIVEAEGLGRSATHARDLEIDLRLHILPRWGTADSATTAAWEHVMVDMHAEGQSWRSIQRIASHLRALLRFACRKGALVNVPEIKSPPRSLIVSEQAERAALPAADRDALLADMRDRGNVRAARCYTVMFFNLFRKSTVERMTPQWINWQTGMIAVPGKKAKNRKPRLYWLHPKAAQAIKDELAEQGRGESGSRLVLVREGVLESGARSPDPTTPIFGKFDHSNVFWGACKRLRLVTYTPTTYDAQGRVLKKAEITDRRGLTAHHVARHTGATLVSDAGASLAERMAAGGWESVQAAQRYDHEDVERSRRALERL